MITITTDDEQFRAYIEEMRSRLGDFTELMDEIGAALVENAQDRFETRTDPNGRPWKAWAPSTRKHYPRPGSPAARTNGPGNGKLLDRYGTMLAGLSHQPSRDTVRVGFAQAYWQYHEFGTRKMPRRGLLLGDPSAATLGTTDEETIVDVLEDWIANLNP